MKEIRYIFRFLIYLHNFEQAFFYRNASRMELLSYNADGKCEPEAGYGYRCPPCRMKKCLESGMSQKGRLNYSV